MKQRPNMSQINKTRSTNIPIYNSVEISTVLDKLHQCAWDGIELVLSMEQALVDLYSCAEHQTYPGNIPLESNLFKLASIPNILQGMFYMFPLFHEGKLFIRYLETGSYSGFLDHILPLLKEQFSVPEVNILPWEIYTEKTFP